MWNQKLLSCACLLLVSALLVVADEEHAEVKLLHYENQQNLDGAGHFKYGVETDHDISSWAEGNGNEVRGEYLLPSEDGQPPKRVSYVAGPSGFKAEIN